jgi:hypothetical protein
LRRRGAGDRHASGPSGSVGHHGLIGHPAQSGIRM